MARPYISPLGAAIAPLQDYLMQREVSRRQSIADALAQEREARMRRNDELDYQAKLEEVAMRRKNYEQASEDRMSALDEKRAAQIEQRTQKGDIFDQETINLLKRTGRGYLITQQGGHLGDASTEQFPEEGPIVRSGSRGGSDQLKAETEARVKAEREEERQRDKKEAEEGRQLIRGFEARNKEADKLLQQFEQKQERLYNVSASIDRGTMLTDALVGPELLTAMAGGLGSGLRMTDTEINRIINGRTPWETLKVKLAQWGAIDEKARQLSPEQIAVVKDLITEVTKRNQDRINTIQEAKYALNTAQSLDEQRMILADLHKELYSGSERDKTYEARKGEPPSDLSTATPAQAAPAQATPGGPARIRYDMKGNVIPEKPAEKPASAAPAQKSGDINLPKEPKKPSAEGIIRPPMTVTTMPPTGNAQMPNVAPSGETNMPPTPMLQPGQPRQLSEGGIHNLQRREGGFVPNTYQDAGGLAIGYGFNRYQGKPVEPGMQISQEEADTEFARQIETTYKPIVDQNLKVPVTQEQYDALISLVYNHPRTALRVIAKLNAGQPVTIEDFMQSATVGGQPNEGLRNRRTEEFEPFNE